MLPMQLYVTFQPTKLYFQPEMTDAHSTMNAAQASHLYAKCGIWEQSYDICTIAPFLFSEILSGFVLYLSCQSPP